MTFEFLFTFTFIKMVLLIYNSNFASMLSEPSITDWISSLAAFAGVPLIIWGFIKIFRKDKNQERKLNALEKLAISQDELIGQMSEQISELARQTSEFQNQSEIMQTSNELISKQIDLQNEIFLHNKVSDERKIELQKNLRINDIKPYFFRNGGHSSSSNISIPLKNKGNTARKLRLTKIKGEFMHFEKLNPDSEVDSNGNIEIKANITEGGRHLDNGSRDYELELYFEDIEENCYKQTIYSRKISLPELLTKG